MADLPAVDDPLASLPIPPLSPYIFSDDVTLPDDYLSFDYDYFGITFDDEHHPSDAEEIFNSTFNQSNPFDLLCSDPEFNNFMPDHETVATASVNSSGNQGSDVPVFVNIPSPDNSGIGFIKEIMNPVRNLENSSLELRNENPDSSQGSGNCGSAGSEAAMICPSPDSGNSVVNRTVKGETVSNFVLKRKNESCDVNSESRTIKHQKSNETSTTTENSDLVNEKDEKKKVMLIRNRERSQLSRHRKKHYVEELEEKVRGMQATIQDLNARISYIAAENATLKHQMVAGGGGAGVCSQPVMYPPHPAMAPVGYRYPWMPCPTPYAVKS
ncbi:hypothetical protein L1987_04372 [Smallanthus sonchifolius]|uniref:Uncharacterized protein n=1 Tax=Smallanthus sonchifolius TaxID=185202 RepID=A0ACB9KD43_9ASTR|nr:hypothetical protein L1987_04372 [Smallanthus sonchifolius]